LSLPQTTPNTVKIEQPTAGKFGSLVFTSADQLKEYFKSSLKAGSLEDIGLLTCTSLCSEERMKESIQKFLSLTEAKKSVVCIRECDMQSVSPDEFISIPYEILEKEKVPVALIKIPSNFFVMSEEWIGKLVICSDQESSGQFFLNSQNLWERHNNKMIRRKMHHYD
jgi:hypothetical protein